MIKFYYFVILSALLLSACADEKKLTGTRKSILGSQQELAVDPAFASQEMVLPPPESNENWTQFMGNANHSSINSKFTFPDRPRGFGIIQYKEYSIHANLDGVNASSPYFNFKRDLTIWNKKLGTGDTTGILQSPEPVIFADTLYWTDKKFRVGAYDLNRKAKKIWKVKLPIARKDRKNFGGGIAVNSELLVVTTGAGQIFALRRSDGELLWQRNIKFAIHGAPTLDGAQAFFTTVNNRVYALNVRTSEIIWQHEDVSSTRATFIGSQPPAVNEAIVVVGYNTGEIVAFDRANGKIIWRQNLSNHSTIDSLSQVNDLGKGFVLDNGAVFIGNSSGRVAALHEGTGQIIWEIPLSINSRITAIGEYLFMLDDQSKLYAVSKRGGKIRWVTQLRNWVEGAKNYKRVVWTGPILNVPYLILVNSEREIELYHINDGTFYKQASFADRFFIAPVIANETLYLVSAKGVLQVIR